MKILMTAAVLLAAVSAHAAALNEGFEDVPGLTGSGWVFVNNSTSIGASGWFQGNSIISAQNGTSTSYAAANFLAGNSPGGISLWMISPTLTFAAGDVIGFYTQTDAEVGFADSLELRLSTNGASIDVGTSDSSVGDFGTLLLSVNPTFATTGGYPTSWAFFSAPVGFSGTGRFAFRYFVNDLSVNGNFIGIDTLTVGSARTDIPEPSTVSLTALAAAALVALRRRKHETISW